ncbi:6977_t:CDS:2 [Funneliformis geosporum]|nr:6977_t:CDS:2 [Funneliformis geosporum]
MGLVKNGSVYIVKSVNQPTSSSPPPRPAPSTKRKLGQQTTLNGYAYSFGPKDQEEMERLLARAFYSAGISFNVVDNPDFRLFLKKACSAFKVPSRYALSNTILDVEYNSLKIDVDNVLEKKEYLCLTNIMELEWSKNIIQSAKYIINYYLKHQVSLAILHRLQMEKYNTHIALLLPEQTRWGSAYYCISNLLKTKLLKIEKSIVQNSEIPKNIQQKAIEFGKSQWNDFLYNPIIMVACNLDPYYRDELLNPTQSDGILEEIIRMTPENKHDAIIVEYSEYIGKLGGFSNKHLWGNITKKPINWWKLVAKRYPILSTIALKILSIPVTSTASERNWSTFSFINNKLRNRMLNQRVEKCVYLYWNMKILREIKEKIETNIVNELDSIAEKDTISLQAYNTKKITLKSSYVILKIPNPIIGLRAYSTTGNEINNEFDISIDRYDPSTNHPAYFSETKRR